jgi:hypothetical protein
MLRQRVVLCSRWGTFVSKLKRYGQMRTGKFLMILEVLRTFSSDDPARRGTAPTEKSLAHAFRPFILQTVAHNCAICSENDLVLAP